jgi:hypothetical protein
MLLQFLCDITRPSLSGVESYHAYWLGVMAAADIADDVPFAGVGFIGFDIGATKWAKVIEHQVNGGRCDRQVEKEEP